MQKKLFVTFLSLDEKLDLILEIDLTCQIHPAKYDYKYTSAVAEEISGQHFDMTPIFGGHLNKPCEKF